MPDRHRGGRRTGAASSPGRPDRGPTGSLRGPGRAREAAGPQGAADRAAGRSPPGPAAPDREEPEAWAGPGVRRHPAAVRSARPVELPSRARAQGRGEVRPARAGAAGARRRRWAREAWGSAPAVGPHRCRPRERGAAVAVGAAWPRRQSRPVPVPVPVAVAAAWPRRHSRPLVVGVVGGWPRQRSRPAPVAGPAPRPQVWPRRRDPQRPGPDRSRPARSPRPSCLDCRRRTPAGSPSHSVVPR